jgi:hypothetical protein
VCLIEGAIDWGPRNLAADGAPALDADVRYSAAVESTDAYFILYCRALIDIVQILARLFDTVGIFSKSSGRWPALMGRLDEDRKDDRI